MTNIIRTFVDKRRKQKEHRKELDNQWKDIIEEQELIEPELLNVLSEQYKPTPEKINELSTTLGIDKDSTESYLLIMYNLSNGTFVKSMDLALKKFKTNEEQGIERARLLPELFQALMEITNAIATGSIKAKPGNAIRKISHFFEMAVSTNEAKFWHTVNEMKNISNGMSSF